MGQRAEKEDFHRKDKKIRNAKKKKKKKYSRH